MFGRRNVSGIWKPKNPHSLDYLNFFLEKNMLGFFLRIMKQKCGRYVCTQLLQTLNIMFENISNETSLYYLLSNNNVNSIITHRFDFSDEEILAYYISFLKTLSLKLNNNTIHFFFNEHTNDFPLYTEAIKFFNHSESMVRIAVRTLTLNVYRVNDWAMLTFIRDNAAAPYFANFVFFIINHVVDINSCVSNGDSSSSNTRDKLSDLVAEHLDHIHYMNDVMRLNIDSLNAVLRDQLLQKLLVPLYLGSLSSDFQFEDTPRVSPSVALFLLSQVFFVVTHAPLVDRLANLLFLADRETFIREGALVSGNDNHPGGNKTDDEKLSAQCPDDTPVGTLAHRPLLCALLNLLDCGTTDHTAFFALCVLYSAYHSSSVQSDMFSGAQVNDQNDSNHFLRSIVTQRLIKIISHCAVQEENCTIRIVTMEACSLTLKELLASWTNLDQIVIELRRVHDTMVARVRNYAKNEPIFLDLFEDEYRQVQARNFSITSLSTDAAMLLLPSHTPLSGVDFPKRLPCGPQEHVRHSIRVFLIIRELLHHVTGQHDEFRSAFSSVPAIIANDCLNLTNSDLLACTVIHKDGIRCQRFLVTGSLQLVLVEPDSSKLGYGVVRFAGFLQDCEVTGDKEDSRALGVSVLKPTTGSSAKCPQPFSVKMVFDDHIRCMAAKQRLTKGRQKARQYKMDLISHLLRLDASDNAAEVTCPSPLLSHVAGRQVPGFVAVDRPVDRHNERADTITRYGHECDGATSSADHITEQRSCAGIKRRVRVLSAESLAAGLIPLNSLGTNEGITPSSEATPKIGPDNVATVNTESCSVIAKRSNSLSPRMIPRFPVEDNKGTSPLALRRKDDKEGIEMTTVHSTTDPSTSASLQCFIASMENDDTAAKCEGGTETPVKTSEDLCCVVVLGMAGSGKSTFVQRITAHLYGQKRPPYTVNLDPAVLEVHYPANIDIRDTVNYEEVMKQYNLGPNGAIITSLNLFATRFDQVATLLEKRKHSCEFSLFDTPGQIEAFTWSASGTIITETLASLFPTVIVYLIDAVRSIRPVTFMSNMLYACSVLYKTKLPFVVVINKIDLVDPSPIMQWMKDFESFQDALEQEKDYISDLTRSLSLTLDEFYSCLKCVKVSSTTGQGVEDFFTLVDAAREEYTRDYRPEYDRLMKEKETAVMKERELQMERLKLDASNESGIAGTSAGGDRVHISLARDEDITEEGTEEDSQSKTESAYFESLLANSGGKRRRAIDKE